MKTRGLVAVLLLLTGFQPALAQKLKLYFSDKQVVEYSVEKVDSLVFTEDTADASDSHEWVDLGLPSGTLWATCNVGANSPEEYGDYFAWGETEPKTNYSWSTYKYCKGSKNTMTKYCIDSDYGTVDNKTELEAIDDAATANWGSEWQMPSEEQRAELINSNYTTTTWTTLNGKYGRKITSKSNGNSIFLPAAGCRYDASLGDAGSFGFYWSRSLHTSYSDNACALGFNSSDISTGRGNRCCGGSVRPVRTNSAQTTVQKIVLYMDGNQTIECYASELDSIVFVDTEAEENDVHEYVDLGLPSGTLWATCNVGANSPEEYGDYFAWGETEPKSDYSWSTYKYCNGSYYIMTKYCTSSDYGTVDNKTELEPSDDAATANWGSDWQMPSMEQYDELINKSYITHTWTTMNGVEGWKITSKSNGNSIFLPAAGYRDDSSLNDAGSLGCYWSRSLYPGSFYAGNTRHAEGLYFHSTKINSDFNARFLGKSVRPVRVIAISNIELSQTVLSVIVGETSQLSATVLPENATNKDVKWASSNTDVATVDETGKVVAVAVGICTITCSAADGSGVKVGCQVKVLPITVTSIELNSTEDSVKVGETLQLSATVLPENATNKNVKWVSSNADVATVDETGKVVAVAVGTCTITCSAADGSGVKVGCQVKVLSITVTSIELNQTEVYFKVGETTQLMATVLPENATNKNVKWVSSNADVATVDETGKVVAVAAGTCTITCSAADGSGVKVGCQVKVLPITVTSIELNQTEVYFKVGETTQLIATVLPDNASNKDVKWESSDTNVATVDQSGKVTALAGGTCTITCSATDGSGVKAECIVTVTNPDNSGTLDGHDYVDLGLPSGTLWATCNVGANSPEEYGDYFAWGETEPKNDYSWSTYKYCKGTSSTMTKYCTNSDYGKVDNKTEVEPSDDAATANWGSGWQMPSKEQRNELINISYITKTWTTLNGVKGWKITSKSNGNSIFLPAAGYRIGTSLYSAGSFGYYWSRSLYTSNSNSAYDLFSHSRGIGTGDDSRYFGQSVRPVRVKN